MSLSEGRSLKPLQQESLVNYPYFMSFYQFLNAQMLGSHGFQQSALMVLFPD